MPIAKGEWWGDNQALPAGAPVVASDAELADLVAAGGTDGDANGPSGPAGPAGPFGAAGPLGPFGLIGGDLCRTLGGRGDRARLSTDAATWVACDVGLVVLDGGEPRPFVAHVVARRPGWRGQTMVAMNAEWVGEYRLGPRAHPGDGLLDITVGSLGLRERLLARSRARTGDHLPHPALRQTRVGQFAITLDRPTLVRIDGRRTVLARRIELSHEPAALLLVV